MRKLFLILFLTAPFFGRAQITFSYTTSTNSSIPMFTSGVSLDSLSKLMAERIPLTTAPQFAINGNDILKPGASDYQVIGVTGAIKEFHNNEVRTANGAVLPLETTYLSENFFANRPTTNGNGAKIVDKGVYAELTIGSGSKPWLVEDAPERSHGALVELVTYANLQSQNNSGAFSIKVPDGSSFQMATSSQGGFIGWKNADVFTSLTVSAGKVQINGQLNANNRISAFSGLNIADGNLTFGQDGGRGFIALQNNVQPEMAGTLTMQSFTINGLYLNASDVSPDNILGGIRLAVNNRVMEQLFTNGIVLGGGLPGGSAILTINSVDSGIVPPKFYDYQLLKMHNVTEGTYVYSLDHHALAWYDGRKWAYSIGQEILQ